MAAAWRKEEEKAAESRRKKREADKVIIAPGVTAGQLRHFRAALIGPLQGPPKHHRLLRREVIGGGVGGPISRSSILQVLDHDEVRVLPTDYGGSHKPLPPSLAAAATAAEAAASSSLLPLLSSSGLRRAGGVSPLGKDFLGPVTPPFSEEAFFSQRGQEEEEEDEEGEDNVRPVLASHRKRRRKMDLQKEPQEGTNVMEGVVARSFPVEQAPSLRALNGLRIVVPPPPGKALLVETLRARKLAVVDEEEDGGEGVDNDEEGNNGEEAGDVERTSPSAQRGDGVIVELAEEWRDNPECSSEISRTRGMLRIQPEVFEAVQELDRGGFIAFTAKEEYSEGAKEEQTAAALSLELRILSSAFSSDGPRSSDVGKWKVLIGWLFPRAVEGFYTPLWRHPTAVGETPPSPAEILQALDAARKEDPDLSTAIHQGPTKPLPPLPELRIDLRNHQKAAIRWMLDAEKEAESSLGHPEKISCLLEDERSSTKDVSTTIARNAAVLGWIELPLAGPSRAAVAGKEEGKASSVEDEIGPKAKGGALKGSQNSGGRISIPAGPESEEGREGSDALAVRPGHVWYHAPSGRLLEDGLPQEWVEFSRISGGILADEMGLGKTVEVLGCILGNIWQNPSPVPGEASLPLIELPTGDGEGDANNKNLQGQQEQQKRSNRSQEEASESFYWDDLTPADEGSACICGRGDYQPLQPGDLCFVQCDSCGWWLHGGCCGFVPSSSASRAKGQEDIEEEEGREFTCVVCTCLRLLKDPQRCGSTLIICPHKIRSQWEREIRLRTKPGTLKIVAYPGVREILSTGARKVSSKRRVKARLNRHKRNSTTSSRNMRSSRVGGYSGEVSRLQRQHSPDVVDSDDDRRRKYNGKEVTIATSREPSVSQDCQPDGTVGDSPVEGGGIVHRGGTQPSAANNGNTSTEAEAKIVVVDEEEAAAASGEGEPSGVGVDADEESPFALLSPERLATYDVVLTTFDVLRAEVHHAESKFADQVGGRGFGSGGGGLLQTPSVPSLRKRKRYRVVPSPLPALKWWRVVIDEAHMVESTTQETAKMALKIPVVHRWCVTGTPLGKGSIDDLFGLLVFLRASPLDNKGLWTSAIREPIDHRLPGAMERLAWALRRVMWRVTKASVSAQIDIPPQTCIDRRLNFSSVEAHFYQKQHRAAADDARRVATKGGRGTEEKLFTALLKLRQACCHPCIGSGGLGGGASGGQRLGGGGLSGSSVAVAGRGGQGRLLTMDQVLDSLIDEERRKAEEAQRKVIMNLNASGAIARLFLQVKERSRDNPGITGWVEKNDTPENLLRDSIACYERALKMAENNRTPGPVTGGAELTGSRGMLPHNRKPRRNQPKPSITDDVAGDIDASASVVVAAAEYDGEEFQDSDATGPSNVAPPAATSPGHPQWNYFIEPRKPFALAWKVRVADDKERNNHGGNNDSGIQGADVEHETALEGDDVGRNSNVDGAVDTIASVDKKDTVIMAEAELSRGYVCRPRDPTWARLIFAERKRILQVRIRCSRSHAHARAHSSATNSKRGDDEARVENGVASEEEGVVGGDRDRACSPLQCVLQAASQPGTFEDVVRFSLNAPSSEPSISSSSTTAARCPSNGGLVQEPTVDSGTGQQDSHDDAAGGNGKGNILVARGGGGDRAGAGAGAGGVADSPPWQEIAVPRKWSVRARDWRIVVETVRVVTGTRSQDKAKGWRQFRKGEAIAGMEVELREAEVDTDDLQILHAAHNLLEVLDQAEVLRFPGGNKSRFEVTQLKQMADRVKVGYTATAVGIHRSSRLQLREAQHACDAALAAAERRRAGRLEWWEVTLRYIEDTSEDRSFVRQAQLELLHESAGQFGVMVRRKFPMFDSSSGLRIALSLKIKEARDRRKDVLRKLETLRTDPGPMEVHTNSNCKQCRSDWAKTGPVCGHCKIEQDIDQWEACLVYFRRPQKSSSSGGGSVAGFLGPRLDDMTQQGPGVNNAHQGQTFKESSASVKLLRLIQSWLRERARGTGVGEDWAALIAESKDFLASWETSEKELISARTLWRAHFDLLSNLDELETCVTPLRLAEDGERIDLLTWQERRSVFPVWTLSVRRREHELERQTAAHHLDKSRGQLAYLNTLVNDERGLVGAKPCAVCHDDLVEEVAVIPCGHSFHPECIDFLLKVGNGSRFRCPICRRSSSASSVSYTTTLDQSDGSAFGLPVKGSWGTKITALVGDVLALRTSDKCLVFSQWDEMLDIVEMAFKENDISYARMKGKKRSELALKSFRASGGPRALILPIKSGSHGLNLVEANHVFMLEPLLNAAVEAQAINRVHRGGQTRPTTVHRLVVRGTIEEEIESLRKKKTSETLPRGGSVGNEASGLSPSKLEGSKSKDHLHNSSISNSNSNSSSSSSNSKIATAEEPLESGQGGGHKHEPSVADNGEDVELVSLTAKSEEREAFSLEDLKALFECSVLGE